MATNKNSYIICNTIESFLKIKSNNTAIREIVKSAEKEMEKTGREWVIRYIPLDLIEVDTDYQRVPTPSEILKIFNNYDAAKVEVKLCSARKDKDGIWHIYLIDGFHTLTVEKMKGHDALCVKFFCGLTKEREADIFSTQNEGKTNLRGKERYKAELVAKKPVAIIIDTLLKKYGLTVKQNKTSVINRQRNINSIEELYRIVKRYGADGLDYVFDMIESANWTDSEMAYKQRTLGGIAGTYEICKNNPEKKAHLLYAMKNDSCEEFIKMAEADGEGDHYADRVKNYCIAIANSCV